MKMENIVSANPCCDNNILCSLGKRSQCVKLCAREIKGVSGIKEIHIFITDFKLSLDPNTAAAVFVL